MKSIRCAAGLPFLIIGFTANAQEFHPDIPRAWDNKEVQGFELPLARREHSPRRSRSF